MIAVVLLLLDGLDDLRQERVSLRYANDHNLSIAALTHDPAGALALVADGVASAVLCAVEIAGGALDEALGAVKVYYARRAEHRDERDVRADLVRVALANSANDYRLVSRLLGMSETAVRAVARAG